MNFGIRSVAVSLLCLFALACGGAGGDQTITNVQQNSTPTGYIEGRVLNAATGMAIAGAVVNTFANGPITATTDANGRYRLGPIPAGSNYTVFVELEGYVKRLFFVGLNGAAGNYPVGNVVVTQDLDMSPANAGVEGQVLTNNGRVAANAAVYIDLRDDNYDLVLSTKTDMSGKFKLTGLPGAAQGLNVTVVAPPFDENADGLPDYSAGSRNINLYPGFNTPATVNISAVAVAVVTSNVSDGEIAPSDAITIDFTTPIDTAASMFTVVQNGGGLAVATLATWTGTTKVALSPVGGPWTPNQSYYIQYQVKALNGATSSNTISFVVRAGPSMPPTAIVTNFKITSPVMPNYDSALSAVSLSWDQVPMVGGYRLYGRDMLNNQAYLRLGSFGVGAGSTSVSLSYFDAVQGDPYNTPLGYGNKIKFIIVPVDAQGHEPTLATAASVEIADNVAPTVTSGQQLSGASNNTAGSMPATIVYRVSFSEPMSQMMSPMITLPAQVTSTWSWNSPFQGNFTITVPAGVNGSGAVSVTAAKDSSGVAQTMAYPGTLF